MGKVTLHKSMKQAVRWRLVPTNVTEGATLPKSSSKEITVLSPDQVKDFFEAIRDHRLGAMYVLATTTGLWQGELLGLRWEDVVGVSGPLVLYSYRVFVVGGEESLFRNRSRNARRNARETVLL